LSIASHVADNDPAKALRLAPHSPDAVISAAMGDVGRAAAAGKSPTEATLRNLQSAARSAPLQAEPFLVEAALAERGQKLARAEMLLKQARWRNPRSIAARYLLADVWLREERPVEGLSEMAVLSRLLPGTTVQLVPALSQYAQSPGAREKLAGILRKNPQLKQPLLIALANDPSNAPLVLALAGSDAQSTDPDSTVWKARLLNAFVKGGDYQRAYSLWRDFARLPANSSPLLFNGDFRDRSTPPPFNWSFPVGSGGVAEPANGKLRVLFYGRQDALLASQLLLLAPGTYRLDSPVSGTAVRGGLAWSVSCTTPAQQLMQIDISRQTAVQFTVPPGCKAQMLELKGNLEDMPDDSDVQVGPIAITRVGQ
jgi:hypothetical protein